MNIELYNVTLTRDQFFDIIFAVESRISSIKACISFLPSIDVSLDVYDDINAAVSNKLIDLQKNLSDAESLVEYLKKYL